jgi:ABC-2 type transport system ATP-binding protein
MQSPHAIETHSLCKRFPGGHGVHGLDLTVPAGAIYGFLGPNGAGKTTTIRLILSLLRPDSGTVSLFGEPITRTSRMGLRHVGALVESPSLYGHLSGRDNLEVTRRLLALPDGRIGEVLALVELTDAAHRPVREFSLGMRQRLALALALLPDPRLLILDEPANGLDPAGIQDLRALLRHLVGERGLTVFLSSHLLSEIELVATHVGVLMDGRLLFQGSLGELRERSQSKLRLVCDPPERAAALLAGWLEKTPERLGETLIVASQGVPPAELNRRLVEAGVAVHELVVAHPSLESLFFDLTGAPVEVAS